MVVVVVVWCKVRAAASIGSPIRTGRVNLTCTFARVTTTCTVPFCFCFYILAFYGGRRVAMSPAEDEFEHNTSFSLCSGAGPMREHSS